MNVFRISLIMSVVIFFSGCASLDMETKKVDYRSVRSAPTLEVPPDLSQPQVDDRMQMPEGAAASFSQYEATRARASGDPASRTILPETPMVRMERAGGQRWLVVNAPPEKVWPLLRVFWEEKGFVLVRDDPKSGIMETDWAENRSNIPGGILRSLVGKVFDRAFDAGERDKFRTRIERSRDGQSTEVYISHRGLVEEYVDSCDTTRTGWVFKPSDPDLEASMMMALLQFIGFEDRKAQAIVRSEQVAAQEGGQPAQVYERAKLLDNAALPTLMVNDGFDRAWRRVGLALDRVGFTVEDRDRAQGIFFVRYIDPEEDANNTKQGGFLSRLAFWRSDKNELEAKGQYRIVVKENDLQTSVIVQDKEGNADSSATSKRILTLLYNQLK